MNTTSKAQKISWLQAVVCVHVWGGGGVAVYVGVCFDKGGGSGKWFGLGVFHSYSKDPNLFSNRKSKEGA